MAILDIDSEDNVVNTESTLPTRVYRSNEEMKTSTLFNKDKNLDTIIQYIKGMKWTVDYFLQIRDLNDTLNPPDLNIPATTQKYNRINKLIITLQSAINQDNLDNIIGEAIINSGFLPNQHDAFIATLTGGREAIFVITNVSTRTYNLHQAYYVEFKLFMFLDTESEVYRDLVYKTMKEYVYDKDHLLDFSAPVILASDYKRKIDLKNRVPELIEHYFRNFIHQSKNVLAIPTDSSIYTDTLLTSFLFKIINQTDYQDITKVTRIDVDILKDIGYTIWDVILNRNISMLKQVNKNIGFKYTPFSPGNVTTRHVSYLGINFIANILIDEEIPQIPIYKDISIISSSDYEEPILTVDNNYVFSVEFYNGNIENMGLLEKALYQYLKGELVDTIVLDKLLEQYPMWDTIDQYYLIPVLIVLVKDSVNNTFKSL